MCECYCFPDYSVKELFQIFLLIASPPAPAGSSLQCMDSSLLHIGILYLWWVGATLQLKCMDISLRWILLWDMGSTVHKLW